MTTQTANAVDLARLMDDYKEPICAEIAEMVRSQAAEIERLRTALKDLHDDSIGFQDRDNWAMKAARAALEDK